MPLDVHDQALELDPGGLDVRRLEDLRASAASRDSSALRSRNADPPRAASHPSLEPAASPTSASRTTPIRCRTTQRQLPSGMPARAGRVEGMVECLQGGRQAGGTVGTAASSGAGTPSVTQVTDHHNPVFAPLRP